MDSSLVIKAKYGDALRRFNVRVDENNRLDLNMVGLRSKICSIYNFPADVNLTLRYVDEDGDLVNLVDDDDLHDVMRQQLKFLKIDVQMINQSGAKSDAGGSSGSATPLSYPPVSDPFLNFVKADALQALPEPIREALYSSFSKAASSNPVLANIADSISKIGQSILNPQGQSHVASGTSSKNGLPSESVTPKAKGPQSPCVDSAPIAGDYARSSGTAIPLRSPGNVVKTNVSNSVLQEALSNLSLSKPASSRQVPSNSTDSIPQTGQSTVKSHYWGPPVAIGTSSKNDASGQVESKNTGVAPVDLNVLPCDPYSSTNVNRVSPSSAVPVSDDKGKSSIDDKGNFVFPNNNATKNPTLGFSAPIDCPFSGTHTLHSMPPPLGNFRISPFKRSHAHSDALNGMFHKGVRCDGCGVYPITGPRFKSKVKENYDLCIICFNEMGNQIDYIRMDRPASFRSPRCSYQNTKEFRHPKIPPPIFKTGPLSKHAKSKLDSRFILDVNVIDGTMMAPSTAFTKIWRMRNNGTSVWPKGTQLVWIGGDKLSDSLSVDLEVPEDGVSVEKELDIAVDFRAPQLPGRYISYWRMASLSGHKFGQRVWVLIQVDASLKDSFYDSSQGLNLNIPLGVGSSEGPRVIDINVQPIEDDVFHQPQNPNAPPEPVNQMVDKEQWEELGNEFPTNETSFVGPAASAPAISASPSSISYPIIDFSGTAPAVPSFSGTAPAATPFSGTAPAAPSSSGTAPAAPSFSGTAPAFHSNQQTSTLDALSSSQSMDNDLVEEALLKELEAMGFKQVDLNKEVLRMTDYNLEQSIDELCGVLDWDPLLQELHEMGFRDKETNRRLLMKNDGSIKRVVMDLLNGE